LVSLIKTLESISAEDAVGYMKLLADVYQRYVVANRHFLQKSFEEPEDFYKPASLLNSIRTKALSTSYGLISKYVKDPRIVKFLCYQALYVGISPFEGPSIYTLVPIVSQLYGLWHLKGGMYSYINALGKAVERLGGTIVTQYDAEEILISDNRAVGIKAKDKDAVFGDIVLCSADFS